MTRKLPDDAFGYYVSLGAARSYSAVADRYGVNKKTVTRAAVAQRWQQRLADAEAKARENTQRRIVETLEDVNDRHLKMLRAVQTRALEALRAMPLKNAADAVRALHDSIKNERLVLGEPSDRTAVSVEDAIKAHYERWMGGDDGNDGGEGDSDGDGHADRDDRDGDDGHGDHHA